MKKRKEFLREYLKMLIADKSRDAVSFAFGQAENYEFSKEEIGRIFASSQAVVYSVLIGNLESLLEQDEMDALENNPNLDTQDAQKQLEFVLSIMKDKGIADPQEYVYSQIATLLYFHLRLIAVPKNEHTQTENNLKKYLDERNVEGLSSLLTREMEELKN